MACLASASSASSDGHACCIERPPAADHSRSRVRGTAFPDALYWAWNHVRHRGRGLCHGLHGAQHPGWLHRPGLVRAWSLVRHGGLCCRADPEGAFARPFRLAGAGSRGARGRGLGAVRRADPEAQGRVFLAADAGACRDDVCHRLPLDGGHRWRGRARRHQTSGVCRRRFRCGHALLHARRQHRLRGGLRAVALSPLARRLGAGRHPRKRAARTLHRLCDGSLQAGGLHHVCHHHGAGWHAPAVQQPHDLCRADFGGVLRRTSGHGRDRRHAFFPGAGAWRAVLRDFPGLSLQCHGKLAALVRPAVRGLHRVLAHRAGRCG